MRITFAAQPIPTAMIVAPGRLDIRFVTPATAGARLAGTNLGLCRDDREIDENAPCGRRVWHYLVPPHNRTKTIGKTEWTGWLLHGREPWCRGLWRLRHQEPLLR